MTTDNRTNESTPEQVEAAAKILDPDAMTLTADEFLAVFGGFPDWSASSQASRREAAKDAARAALEAAQGAAPQAESEAGKRLSSEFRADLVEAARERIQAVWADVPEGVDAKTLAQNVVSAQEFFWLSLHFPVLPSSTVDEAALIREAKAEALEEFADQMATGFNQQTLNAERRAIKREARTRAAEYREGSET